MTAVLLACAAGALLGGVAVSARLGLGRVPDAEAGALAIVAVALAVTVAAVAIGSDWTGSAGELWPYLLGGLLAPGLSQLLFVLAIRDAGASRTGIVVGAAPLVASLLAIGLFGEPVRSSLIAGTVLVVAGGALLVGERDRPAGFRARGLLLALGCGVAFAVRDNIARWAAGQADVSPLLAALVIVGSGGVAMAAVLYVRRGPALAADLRRAFVPFAPAGLLFGLSYLSVLEALERGRVTVVSPLVATESLWAVLLAWLVFRRAELVGWRLALAAVLVVGGAVLVGRVQ